MSESFQRGSNPYQKRSRARAKRLQTWRARSPILKATGEPLGVEGNMRKPIVCDCGWSGTISDLKNPRTGPTLAGLDLGPGFPVCPRCKTDENLQPKE